MSETFVLDPKVLEYRKIEVGKGYSLVLGRWHDLVGAGLVTATCHEDGQVVVGVCIPVAHATSKENRGLVKQRRAIGAFV